MQGAITDAIASNESSQCQAVTLVKAVKSIVACGPIPNDAFSARTAFTDASALDPDGLRPHEVGRRMRWRLVGERPDIGVTRPQQFARHSNDPERNRKPAKGRFETLRLGIPIDENDKLIGHHKLKTRLLNKRQRGEIQHEDHTSAHIAPPIPLNHSIIAVEK